MLSILVPRGIMNQIVRDQAFHISPQGYHEPNSELIWKARSRTIWFLIPLGINMESQVTDYLVHDTLGD
jgi:hypothetical protein